MKYSRCYAPSDALNRFNKVAGNYRLEFMDASSYVGRQSSGVSRIGSHVREHGEDLRCVRFQKDRKNDPCERYTREDSTLRRLRTQGRPVRNKIHAAMPRSCPVKR